MRLPRLTTRRLMVLVAVVAIGLAGDRWYKLSRSYWHRARSEATARVNYLYLASELADDQPSYVGLGTMLPNGKVVSVISRGFVRRVYYDNQSEPADQATVAWLVAMCKCEAAVCDSQMRKFARASRYPWLPVPPDPPRPSDRALRKRRGFEREF